MRLLVTRPEPDAMRTAARLGLDGHEALVMPLIEIEFAAPPAPFEPAALVLTSRNGVRALQRWPQAIGWRHLPLFAVGEATAGAAAEAGFTKVRSAGGGSGELADLIMRVHRPGVGPLLYPAGRERAGDIEGRLKTAGFDISVVEAYAAHPATAFDSKIRARLKTGTIDGILFYSRRTAAIFTDLIEREALGAALAGVTLFAISADAAAPLSGLAGRVAIADAPNEDAMIALVEGSEGTAG